MLPTLVMAGLCILLFPALLSPQRPDSPGKLRITSTPPGAAIKVDNQRMPQPTDFTFTVSPGVHNVVVIHANLPKCAKAIRAKVSPGSVTQVSCTVDGWGEPTYR